MDELELFRDDRLPERPSDPEVTAADILAALIDLNRLHGVVVTGRAKGIIGRQAKELLADGVPPRVVLIAAERAYRRAQPHLTHMLAIDVMQAQAGRLMTAADWRRELRLVQAKTREEPEISTLLRKIWNPTTAEKEGER